MIRAAILGASGYVGGELMRLIALHPAMQVGIAFGASNAGQEVAAVHPHLSLAYPDMAFAAWDPALLSGCDLIFASQWRAQPLFRWNLRSRTTGIFRSWSMV